MKNIKLAILFFVGTLSIWSQNPNRIFESFTERKDLAFEVKVNDGTYLIKFYSPEIVETTFIPEGEVFNPKSHAVVLTPQSVETNAKDEENSVGIFSKGLSVTVYKNPFQIAYSYKDELVISEKGGYNKNDSLETIQFNLTKDEILYGGGARALGMNRRGYKLPLFNRAHYGYETHSEQMNFTMPIVLSSKQYMVHFDNAPIGLLDLDSKGDNTLTYETISGRKTYQVIVGNSWYNLINNYTDLTGKQPLPPRWALGNFSSRFGYHTQTETEATIDKFKDENIPVDAIILDLYWFGKEVKGTMGNLEVFRDSFPDFEGMVSRLKNKGVKTVLITEPFILTTSNRWQEAVTEDILAKDSLGNPGTYDFYFGNTGLIDIYKPKAEQWFWNIYKELADKGVSGFWGDLGEPEVHPSSLVHATGSADEVHNIYGHDWARLVYEGYQRDFQNQRPFILMRAGYSGSQRYGLIPWSGDVSRSWGGLQSQPEIALQMGMQGLAYMHSDLGGFAGANLDDELYVRWLQYGVFQPIYRPHAQEEVPSEPVFRSDKAKALAKEAIELRYKLLPYSYNLAFQNNQTGAPLMRPLFFEEPKNQSLFSDSSTYLWGNDFLITPILKADKRQQTIYFPKDNTWYDFYTDEMIEGGQSKDIQTKENSIPTYVRGGAFVLMAKPMQNTEEYKADRLELHYYNDSSIKNSQRKFYNDDGKTANAFEKEVYELLVFKSKSNKKGLELEFIAQTGKNYVTSNKQISVVVHNIQKEPKRIKIDGIKVKFNWNSQNKTLTVPVVWNTSKNTKILLK